MLCDSRWTFAVQEIGLTAALFVAESGVGETKAKYTHPSPLALNTHGCQFTRYPTLQNRSGFARASYLTFCVSGSQCIRTGFHGHSGDGCFGGRIAARGDDGDLRGGL